jgi:hypothetical protein
MERACAVLLLSFLVAPMAHAADAHDCRNLLTIDEVSSAVGGDAELTNATTRGEVGADSTRNDHLEVCSWATSSFLAGVNLDVVPALDAASIGKGLAVVQYPLDERRRQHWAETKLDFNGVHCSSLSPPTDASNQEPQVTGCVGEVRGAALYVGVSNRTERPTFDLVKRLFDDAAARL